MNGSQKFTYMVDIDVASAEAAAKKLQSIYQQALAQIKMPTESGQNVVAAMQAQQSQMSAAAKAGSSERVAAMQAESAAKIKQASDSSTAIIAAEKRTTAAVQQEAAARQSSLQKPQLGGELIPGFGGAQSLLSTSVAGIGIGFAAKQIVDTSLALDAQATSYKRVELAAKTLAGSQSNLNALMKTYDEATGGMVDKQTSLATVTRLMSVGFADSTEELEKFTRAVRGISVATGQNQDYIGSQLQLAIANQSTMRLDQLGLGVSEVKDRIEELRAANSELTKEQAYQEAILGLATEKYGALTTATDAQATSVEKLKVAWANWRIEAAQAVTPIVESIAEGARQVFFPDLQDIRQRLVTTNEQNRSIAQPFGLEDMGSAPLEKAIKLIDDLNKKMAEGEHVPEGYASAVRKAAEETLRFGNVGTDTARTLDAFTLVMASGAAGTMDLQTALAQAEQDTRDVAAAAEDADAKLIEFAGATRTAAGELGYLVDLAYSAGAGLDDLGDKADAVGARLAAVREMNAPINAINQQIGAGILRTGVNLSGVTGTDAAKQQIADAQGKLESQIADLKTQGIRDPTELAFRTKQLEDGLIKPMQDQIDADKEATRAREAADRKAASAWESAAKKTASEMEAAAKKMAAEFESALHDIPGLFAPSAVTAEDMDAAKGGYYQEKADEYLRRLMDEAGGGTDYANVDVKDAAKAIGMDENSAPMAIANAFKQAWASGSLWSDPTNIEKFINKDAVVRELEQKQRGEQGQNNLLNWLGLDPRIVAAAGFQGVLPGRLGGDVPADWMMNTTSGGGGGGKGDWSQASAQMQAGLGKGADSGLQQFGLDAVTTISNAMTGEQAQAQWDTLGESVGQMMTTAIETGIAGTDFVGVVVAAALAQINAALENTVP
jgi:hypothetical protein